MIFAAMEWDSSRIESPGPMPSSASHQLDVRGPPKSTPALARTVTPSWGDRILAGILARSGRGAVWQRTWLGAKGSEVRILSPRPSRRLVPPHPDGTFEARKRE